MKILKLINGFLVGISIIVLLVVHSSSTFAVSADDKTNIAVFVRVGCVHCQDEEAFLQKLQKEVDYIDVTYYRLESQPDREQWNNLTTRLGIAKVTPITIIGDTYIVGFGNDETTGQQIRKLIQNAQNNNTPTDVKSPNLKDAGVQNSTCPDDGTIPCVDESGSYFVTLPFIGKIDAQKYPLLLLSAVLGFIDGFNPCAMWVLVTFLIILIEIGNRRKMIIFAGTFILDEAIMYSLILTSPGIKRGIL